MGYVLRFSKPSCHIPFTHTFATLPCVFEAFKRFVASWISYLKKHNVENTYKKWDVATGLCSLGLRRTGNILLTIKKMVIDICRNQWFENVSKNFVFFIKTL